MIDDKRLDELERLAQAATPGPNVVVGPSGDGDYWVGFGERAPKGWFLVDSSLMSRADADYTAAARDAVPELCAEVRRLKKELSNAWSLLLPPPNSPLMEAMEEEVDQSVGNLMRVARERVWANPKE